MHFLFWNFLEEENENHFLCCLSLESLDAWTPTQVLVYSNSDFAFQLFRKISSSESHQGDRSNIAFSPLCISSAFAMRALGTKDNTLDQILKGLDFRGAGHQMEIGKFLSVQNQLNPEKQFLNGLKNFYGGDLFGENFNNTAATEQHINSYIKRKTRGKISKLVDEVDPITEILLISYIYMKVHSTSFSSDKPGLHCILNVTQKSFFDSNINVYIPKYLVSGEIKLKNIMYSMGVADVFIDQPIHKAVIMIDEKETEASTATSRDLVLFIAIVQEQNTESILFMKNGRLSQL
uniref:Thyroxine-binding globulin n=1 Tax=Pseudonaja textilis TaxID=8673 RepID=A0A670ZVV3_PSETE